MSRKTSGVFVVLELALAAADSPQLFRTDLTLHQTTTSTGMMGGGGGPQDSTLCFSGNAMKQSSSDGSDFIIRFDQSKMVFIDNKKKTYSEMTFDELQQTMDRAAEQLKGMNTEQLEAMRKLMGQTTGEVKATHQGAGETIAGYATEKYLVSMPPMEMEIWSAPGLTVPAAYYNALKLRMPRNPILDMGKMYDEMKKVKGMTMKSIISMKMMNMNTTTTSLVTSVEKGAIAASTFDVPAGYTAAPFPGAQSPGRKRP